MITEPEAKNRFSRISRGEYNELQNLLDARVKMVKVVNLVTKLRNVIFIA